MDGELGKMFVIGTWKALIKQDLPGGEETGGEVSALIAEKL